MRVVSADSLDFSNWLKRGDCLAWGQAGAEPLSLTRPLFAQRHSLGGFTAFVGLCAADTMSSEYADVVRYRSYCGAGENRGLAKAGLIDILPCHYSQMAELLKSGQLRVDVLLLQLAPADAQGRYSLSIAHEYLIDALERARLVIVEINERAPWTYGERYLLENDIDIAVLTNRDVVKISATTPTDIERSVASRVAQLIEDHSTLQVGIGTMPAAVMEALNGHRDLGVHTGALTDATARLAQRGVITNASKSIDRGVTIAGVMMGSEVVYDYASQNPKVQFRSVLYTHSAAVLATLDRFVAINSALEVDLTGQINAEAIGGSYVGAVGGALDFLRGAHSSRGGLPIVALPSIARSGNKTISRIVARLSGPVSTPRSDAGLIVTEHGVADLRGLSLSERQEKMLAISDPRFHELLDSHRGVP
jgi:acyl-CoA hydrolase